MGNLPVRLPSCILSQEGALYMILPEGARHTLTALVELTLIYISYCTPYFKLIMYMFRKQIQNHDFSFKMSVYLHL